MILQRQYTCGELLYKPILFPLLLVVSKEVVFFNGFPVRLYNITGVKSPIARWWFNADNKEPRFLAQADFYYT